MMPGGDFVVHFWTDLPTAALLTPFTASTPLGSLVYEGDVSGAVEQS